MPDLELMSTRAFRPGHGQTPLIRADVAPISRSVSTQAPNASAANRAVGTHHRDGPTQIPVADYSLRHRRDGNAGTTILYHPRIYRRGRPHSSSVMTAGRRSCWRMGTAAASAGAARPSEGLRAGRSCGRTAGVHRGERTTRPRDYGSGPTRQSDDRDSEPDYLPVLRPTRHGPGGTLRDY